MQKKIKKVAIYIGKFQPLHKAHEEILNICLNDYDETIVLVGSVNRRISIKHPFIFQEIKKFINNFSNKIIVKPIKDYIYNEKKWITEVIEAVYNEFSSDEENEYEFTIIGHNKDESSYYLKSFPGFKVREVENFHNNLSSTKIREIMFNSSIDFYNENEKNNLENPNVKFIFENTSEIVRNSIFNYDKNKLEILRDEYDFYKKEKELFIDYPFPETLKFSCADAVVTCEGNVLLVKRKFAPGKNIWALPGGFVNSKETFEFCSIRELKEETGIKIPFNALKQSIKDYNVFDNPNRNIGLPKITIAYYYEVYPDKNKRGYSSLPKVSGSDDASEAKWFSLAEVKRMNLFDDHSDIIDYFTSSI